MTRPTTAPEALRTLRQRGSVAMGVIAVALGVVMAVLSALSGEPSLVMIGFLLLLAGGGWVLFVRPNVVITMLGVELNNPFRQTHIPWSKVEDVAARWNLEVYAEGRDYPAWAVASHIERPQSQGLLGFGRLGAHARKDAVDAPAPSRGATVGSTSRMIESAKDEWTELVAAGDSAVVRDGEVTRVWQWLDVVCVAAPIVLVVVGFLL
ncbi:MAG: PH domain-containing protein [Actinomycetota bacterium]|nr:PH domain-containing protein [Actinomycetota bacterium]